MLDREPLKRDPNARRAPETAVGPNRGARHGPCSLAARAGTEHGRPSGAGIRGIPVNMLLEKTNGRLTYKALIE